MLFIGGRYWTIAHVDSRTLPEFLQDSKATQDLVSKNRSNVLLILRELSEQSTLVWQETCVLALAQLARFVYFVPVRSLYAY